MTVWENFRALFLDSLTGHGILLIYLFPILNPSARQLKKLPVLLVSPLLASAVCLGLERLFPAAAVARYCASSCAILLLCTVWVSWACCTGLWQAFAAVCMAGIFQVALANLSRILFHILPLDLVAGLCLAVSLAIAALLYRLGFGAWLRLLLEDGPGPRQTALFLFVLEAAMEAFLLLQKGVQPDYLVPYCLLVLMMAALLAGLVLYLARYLSAARRLEAQRDMIAQQQLYEQNLEDLRREMRCFRHDYKNLLAGLSQQACQGALAELQAALRELDAGFDRRLGEKIHASAQIGNLRLPQVRSLLLSKLAAMRERGVQCRLEVLYPVEGVAMDVWDFTRCLGILTDNAVEAALETDRPWTEIVLLAQKGSLSLRVSNPYAGAIDPDRLWPEGASSKGEGRGLGLAGYQRVLAQYPNASTLTSWEGGVFVQELTVEGRP